MKKLLTIGLKDLTLALRDRAALILMFAAPLALTLGLGFVTGRFSGQGNDSGLSNIPVVIVNQDGGQLGFAMVDAFRSPQVGSLVASMTSADPAAAHKLVDDDKVAAAVIVPEGFTDSIIPAAGQVLPSAPDANAKRVKKISVYANAGRPVGAGVIQSIVEEYLARVEAGQVSGQIAITQLIANGLIKASDANAYGQRFGREQANATASPTVIVIKRSTVAGASTPQFDVLAVFAPGMALLFLMYTVTRGGMNLLAERDGGTLARLMVTPTRMAHIVGGKVLGVFLTAVVQVAILIVVSSLLFGLRWGDAAGVVALVLAVAAGATGWGMAIAAIARTPAMVGSVGSAAMLLFGVLGGSFGDNIPLTGFLQVIGKATPNAWGVQGFARLAAGGALGDILPNVMALCLMAALLFSVAVVLFRRNGFVK